MYQWKEEGWVVCVVGVSVDVFSSTCNFVGGLASL